MENKIVDINNLDEYDFNTIILALVKDRRSILAVNLLRKVWGMSVEEGLNYLRPMSEYQEMIKTL